MPDLLSALKALLREYGATVNARKEVVEVHSAACIDAHAPASPGVYWIETTMPVGDLRDAITAFTGKEKRVRVSPPHGAKLIQQSGTEFYVAYSGTEENIRKRLRQHLLAEGNQDTVKLGCVIDKRPFSNYRWRVGHARIDSYEIRYAVEAWWRLNVGWPPFCLR